MSDRRRFPAANTSAYAGYDLAVALERIAAQGYRRVEIAAMVGIAEHLTQEQLTMREAVRVRGLLRQNGLENVAFSAHLHLHRADAVKLFLPRLDFAGEIGASIVNTKAGPPSDADAFRRNMEALVRHAEKIGITIGLETHGDIVTHGRAAVEAVRSLASPHVILNYDFGNVFVNSSAGVDPAADYELIRDEVGHLHLKDVVERDGLWQMCAVGAGSIDYVRVLEIVRRMPCPPPMTVEIGRAHV